jgi:poly-gamma-glutamate synthase PgsB/CapB
MRDSFWQVLATEWTSRGAMGAAISAVAFLVPALYWWVRLRKIQRGLLEIPIRILVTGSRGKSSLVRHLHAVFLAAGYSVYAKTTGTAAAEITSNNGELETHRYGQVCVLEMVETNERVIRKAKETKVIIYECMAVSPKLISLVARLMVKPTVVVITNALFDHLEEEGKTHAEIAHSLVNAIAPETQYVITADHLAGNRAIFEVAATLQDAKFVFADSALTADSINNANPNLHKDNVAVCAKIGEIFSMPTMDVVEGLKKTSVEKSDREIVEFKKADYTYRFYDFGSINDTESLNFAWQSFDSKHEPGAFTLAILVNRWDRPLRAISFASNVSPIRFDAVGLIGELDIQIARELLNQGWDQSRILRFANFARFSDQWLEELHQFILQHANSHKLIEICLLENIHNPLADRIRERLQSEVKNHA